MNTFFANVVDAEPHKPFVQPPPSAMTPKPYAVSAQDIRILRDRSGAGLAECKEALDETQGDLNAALSILKAKGNAVVVKSTTLKEITGNSDLTSACAQEHEEKCQVVEVPRSANSIMTKFIPGDLVWLMVNNKAATKKVSTVTIRLVPLPEAIRLGYDIRIELLLDEPNEWNKGVVASTRSDETYCFHTKADLLASL